MLKGRDSMMDDQFIRTDSLQVVSDFEKKKKRRQSAYPDIKDIAKLQQQDALQGLVPVQASSQQTPPLSKKTTQRSPSMTRKQTDSMFLRKQEQSNNEDGTIIQGLDDFLQSKDNYDMRDSNQNDEVQHKFKSFENDYEDFLKNETDAQQHMTVSEQKQELMKPREQEQKHKENFISNLNTQNKIDSYDVTLKPIMEELIKEETLDIIKRKYQGSLNEKTLHIIQHIFESGNAESDKSFQEGYSSHDQSCIDTVQEETYKHSICHVEMEYIAYDNSNKKRVLVVKTIEEMRNQVTNKFNVIQTLRIFHEVEMAIQVEKPGKKTVNFQSQKDQKRASFFGLGKMDQKKSKSDKGMTEQIENLQFQEVKKVIISDTGPLESPDDDKYGPQHYQATSTIFQGSHLFFYQKKLQEPKYNFFMSIEITPRKEEIFSEKKTTSKVNFMLQDINLETLEQTEWPSFEANIQPDRKLENVQIFFAQEGSTFGRKMNFKEREFCKLNSEEELLEFLHNQFIIVVDNKEISNIKIFCLRDLEYCISSEIQLKDSEIPRRQMDKKFNQFFVYRDCENSKSQLEILLKNKIQKEQCLYCLYNDFYISLRMKRKIHVDKKIELENLTDAYDLKCQLNFIAGYDPKFQVEKKKPQHQTKKMKHVLQIINNQRQHEVQVQVKCLQQQYVYKYTDFNDKNLHLNYFPDQKKDQEEDLIQFENIFYEKGKHGCGKVKQKFIKITYFMDEGGNIQVLHHDMKQEEEKYLEEMNEFYSLHIMTKIGHPHVLQKQDQQIKVTFVKDNLKYEDTKFPSRGLIEYYVKQDEAFQSRVQQYKLSNYLVTQTNRDQYLFVYKQNNLTIIGSNMKSKGDHPQSQNEFRFDIIKIKHKKGDQNLSVQTQLIIDMLNSHSKMNISQIPQIRINQLYTGTFSTWWSVRSQNYEHKQIDMIKFDENENINEFSWLQPEMAEASINYMVLETFKPPAGLYFRVKIFDDGMKEELEKMHQQVYNRVAKVRFFFIPITYFPANKPNTYYIIFEFKVYFRANVHIFFVVENMLVKFEMKQSYEDFNDKDNDEQQVIIDGDTEVQFFKPTEDSKYTSDDMVKDDVNFILSKPKRLSDYNLYKSRFFDFDNEEKTHETDFSKTNFKVNVKQIQLKFEKIVDSHFRYPFFPFISFEKKVSTVYQKETPKTNIFDNFKIQCISLLSDPEEAIITPYSVAQPQKKNRKTIEVDNQIQLWRSSDFYQNKQGQIIVHYKTSYIFTQAIDRIQIYEFKLTFTAPSRNNKKFLQQLHQNKNYVQNGKIQYDPIERVEKLKSSINTQTYNEYLQIIQQKIDFEKSKTVNEQQRKKLIKLVLQRNQYIKTNEKLAAESLNLKEFGDDGYLINENQNIVTRNNDLTPFIQAYKSPILYFGYDKKESNDARSFDLTIHSRLNEDFIKKNIFNSYEVFSLFKQIIIQMLQMKPVMMKDFDFLLLHTYQTFEFKIQMQESFFQPQELFMGQTMCDINLNESQKISDAIQNFRQKVYQDLDSKSLQVNQIEGSLFDMVTQNSPFCEIIKQNSQLGVGDYLIVSKDFNFKTQIMRSLEINAEKSYLVLMDSIGRINSQKYSQLLEHDLVKIMDKKDIKEIYDFFDVSSMEETEEQKVGEKNLFCNFEFTIQHQLLPTIWNKDGVKRIPMNKFKDPQNEIEEIVDRLINIAQEFKQTEDAIKVEVKHKVVDFQKVTLGQKIKELYQYIRDQEESKEKGGLEDFQYTFDDLCLAKMMLTKDNNREFYELDTAQQIVDAQFDTSKKFYSILFMIYLLTFILPLVVAFAEPDYNKVCYVISLTSLSLFFIIEICQMSHLGIVDYLFDFWNIVDSTQFIVFGYLTYDVLNETVEDGIILDKSVTIKLLYIVALLQAFGKSMFFARIYDDYGFLVRMIGMTMKELLPLIFFFLVFTLFFALAYMALGIDIDTTRPGPFVNVDTNVASAAVSTSKRSASPKYPGINKNIGYLLYSFRNSIGDLSTPNYDDWLIMGLEDADDDSKTVITQTEVFLIVVLSWTLWSIQSVFMIIILLNYLIAVISQAYERVVNQRKIYQYIHRAEVNQEYFQILRQLRIPLNYLKFMIFVESSNISLSIQEDQWLGFVDAIRKFINQQDGKIRESFNKIISTLNENSKIQQKHHNQFMSQLDQVFNDTEIINQRQERIKKSLNDLVKQFDANGVKNSNKQSDE